MRRQVNPKAPASGRASDGDAAHPALAKGMEHHRAGDLESADNSYRAVKRRDPNFAEASRLRGLIAYQRGDLEAAAKLLRQAVKAAPRSPIHHHSLAEVLRTSGDPAAAIEPYRRAAKLDSNRFDNHMDLANTLAEAGDADAALATYRELAARWPDAAPAQAAIATFLCERGEPVAAYEHVEAWQAKAVTDVDTHHALARAWTGLGEHERAEAIYRDLVTADESDAQTASRLGNALQSQGQFDEAVEWLERALDLDPTRGGIYAALMSQRDYVMTDERLARMRELAADPTIDAASRDNLYFALGHWYDQQGEASSAFTSFETANRLHATQEPFDRDRFDARVDRMINYFDADFFADRPATGVDSDKPVFVVGMPRSGTSLVEQIIASHPQAHGAGELEDMRRLVREVPTMLGGRQPFPKCLDRATSDQLAQWSERYLGALNGRAPEAARVVDKMPFNMLWLGLIALLFPNARVVYCRREAMDNCLSCYFQRFASGLRFSYDLSELGQVYRQHERLMAHWADSLPLSMLTVDYESLVAEPEPQIRRLIDFTGLDWDERCLAAHQTERSVRTASVWQVRQPVYTSSVARWKTYEPWLGELKTALADAEAP